MTIARRRATTGSRAHGLRSRHNGIQTETFLPEEDSSYEVLSEAGSSQLSDSGKSSSDEELDSFFNAQSVHFTSTAKYVDPSSYADAMSRPDAKLWQEAFTKK